VISWKIAVRILATPVVQGDVWPVAYENSDAGVDDALLRSLLGLARAAKSACLSTTLTPHLFSSFA